MQVTGRILPSAEQAPDLFDRCVIRTARGRSIRCRKGLWAVATRDAATTEREARRYWTQYFEDGEYDALLGINETVRAPVKAAT